ncbi:DUF5753 domain-containing protein [Streptomyces sp. NRRL F-5126]|uniref:DUF5753 domain-containing protein n=1 Tax=Streptomyces sp. NRRL F-5126 TaxID=1463857 RepID=UPI0004C83643|nr:DUF5753 domain-containing protein [Streptomyces sp. NRRL F-5126]
MSAPTVRRRRLGAKLRALRGSDTTLQEVSQHSRGTWTVARLSRLETAKSRAKASDVDELLDLYEKMGRTVSPELRTALLALTRQGNQRGWWHSYRGVLTPVYEDLISLEAEATSLETWQQGAIPGLLHTPGYAREVIRATAMSEAVEARVDALVQVRLARQAVLTADEAPLSLWAVISEHALQAPSHREGVMHDQLGRLLDLAERPNINIQVLPTATAPHAGVVGNFTILGFDDYTDLDVVHQESLTSTQYIEDRGQVAVYRDAYARLQAAALPVEASAARITEIRKNA